MSRRGLFCCGSRLVEGRLEDEEEPSGKCAEIFVAEVLGTGALILLGDGVVAGVLLNRSKAQNSGWIVITMAWAFAVFVRRAHRRSVQRRAPQPGGHARRAARTAGSAFDQAIVYWAAEMLGAFIGAVLVFLHYYPHWSETEDADLKLAVYSTGPAIRNTPWNSGQRDPRHLRADVRDLHHRRTARHDGPRRARPIAGGVPGPGHRPGARRHHRLRDQPRPRPRPAHRALPAADPRQARLRLGVLVGPGGRAAHRRRRRVLRLQLRRRQLT